MGYRSEIYALVHGSDLIPFLSTVKEGGLSDYFGTNNFREEDLDEDGYARFTAENLKWYDGYPEVDNINAIFRASKHSILMRVGEDHTDGEDIEYYSGEALLQEKFAVSHHVSVDF